MRTLRDCLPALLVLAALAMPADAAELALKRVMLSSGGVGYFEYEASVDGDASLTLDVPLDQVDDVLKSLVVYDAGGRAGEITLPGREPLAQSLGDLPVDPSALGSATALLNALQGSEVRVGGDAAVVGRLLHAEDVTVRGQDDVTDTLTRVTVLTDSGLRQATLRDLDAIEFVDPALQAKLKAALAQVAAYRAHGRRQLTIDTHGTGKRSVRIGYVVAMPLWKASYRLVLPADANAGSVRLQGWAVLENFSGQNWSDVELTLLSGNPVTFRQALYESYYVPRPTVPVESGNRVLPSADTGTFGGVANRAAENAPSPVLKAAPRGFQAEAATIAPQSATMPAPAPPPVPPPAQAEEANAAEGATQIAFTLPHKVSVTAGQSLVVPLIDRELPMHRVDLYQPATAPLHPLAAIELTNAADTGLPPGVLTLYQQAERGAEYLGDARLSATPAGGKRLLNYAVDEKVAVDTRVGTRQSIVKATIAEGVMHVSRLQRRTTTYQVSSAAPPPRLVIEQPKLGGWNLTAPDNAERTASAYRIPAALDPKGNGTVVVVEEQPNDETIELRDLADGQLGAFVSAPEIDPKLRQALGELAQHRQKISRQQTELDRLNNERGRLMEDETRLRDNYTALKDDPAMSKSTLDKLKTADAAIDDNAAATAKANAALGAAQAELAAFINSLKL
ncbi:MAG TPA: DUF4139 domain-containing protein [Stellaceae bacterium]|nr:DUF4139 domain-containing protein [Stellaceae bacterium]